MYVAAVAPDEDETAASQQAKFPTTELFGRIEVADGRIWMLPSGIGYFCGDLSEEEQQVVWATAAPPAVELFNEKPKGTAWRTKPSAYIVANNGSLGIDVVSVSRSRGRVARVGGEG